MCVVAPGQDDAPNDESFVPVDEGNADNGEPSENVVGNSTVTLLLSLKNISRCPQVQGGQSEPG